MPKKRGVEGAAERLRALLAQVEEAVERVTEEVERDEGEGDVRPTLVDLLHCDVGPRREGGGSARSGEGDCRGRREAG